MGGYVADQVLKLMTQKRIHVVGANILTLGLTFKESCPDFLALTWRCWVIVFPVDCSLMSVRGQSLHDG